MNRARLDEVPDLSAQLSALRGELATEGDRHAVDMHALAALLADAYNADGAFHLSIERASDRHPYAMALLAKMGLVRRV